MKNRESSKKMKHSGSIKSNKQQNLNLIDQNIKSNKKSEAYNSEDLMNLRAKSNSKRGPSKSEINRLKNFYYTTRWLPNSAFTTYFGKPAFENYGYGNTKPIYGGLFYGNYMLTHNINPIDGENKPDTKQVYSSAMLKTIKNNKVRKPEPPRKVPDEIRNTPDELQEMKSRKPIFQQENMFPERYIIKPNLVKSSVFKSAKNTPENTENDKENEIYERFNIEDVLEGKQRRRKSTAKTCENTTFDNVNYNPFGPNAQRKKNKEKLNLKSKPKNSEDKNDSKVSAEKYDGESIDEMEGKFNQDEYMKQVEFYEKMLNENNDNNRNNENVNEIQNSNKNDNMVNTEDQKNIDQNVINHVEKCSLCEQNSLNESRRFKKKENPCLMDPQIIKHTHVCCVHQACKKLSFEEMDPRNYKYMPSCALDKIIPAGKPTKQSDPVSSIFQ